MVQFRNKLFNLQKLVMMILVALFRQSYTSKALVAIGQSGYNMEVLYRRRIIPTDAGQNFSCHNDTDCGGASRGICNDTNNCDCLTGFSGHKCGNCVENRYAVKCAILCNEVTNCSGHGRCSWRDGSCICFQGWSGVDCSQNTVSAAPEPACMQPKEICCTRLWSNASKSLVVLFSEMSWLSSLMLRSADASGAPLLHADAKLPDLAVFLVSRKAKSVTQCLISLSGTLNILAEPSKPATMFSLQVDCSGMAGDSAVMSLPLTARPALVAARICVIPINLTRGKN